MAGIFFIYPALERLYPEPGGGPLGKADPLRRIWKAAVMSVSCQAATAPLAWHYFHSFPRYFIITNLVALPVTSAVMLLSVATVALSSMGICPDWLVSTGDFAVQALLQCLGTIASL
jgi:competence protein ComEC